MKACAISDNVPCRDLLLSPDHAVFIDGILIQAGALVNGTSIVRENRVSPTFTYYHVELEDHSLILAENMPAESFVDNVDRMAFDNWAEHEALYPEGNTIVELPYPRAKSLRQVPRKLRDALAARGAGLYGVPAAAEAACNIVNGTAYGDCTGVNVNQGKQERQLGSRRKLAETRAAWPLGGTDMHAR
jgi:hypothetical protein